MRSAAYACAIILREGKVLLGKRAPFRAAYPECWDFIGGKIKRGETPQQALGRELGEEIAISPEGATFFASLEDTYLDAQNPPRYHFFKVTRWTGGDPVINNHEHSDLAWFTHTQACHLSDLALPSYRHLLTSAMV